MSLTLYSLQSNLRQLDVRREIHAAIVETSDDIIKFNTSQLFSGVRANNSEIRPPYAFTTVLYKDLKGQPSDRVTLKDTGAFYKSFFVDVMSDTYEIYATDSKTEKLTSKYGVSIFGLTRMNRSQYIEYSFFPSLRGRIESRLKIKFGYGV